MRDASDGLGGWIAVEVFGCPVPLLDDRVRVATNRDRSWDHVDRKIRQHFPSLDQFAEDLRT